jgi:hypothetical protein
MRRKEIANVSDNGCEQAHVSEDKKQHALLVAASRAQKQAQHHPGEQLLRAFVIQANFSLQNQH